VENRPGDAENTVGDATAASLVSLADGAVETARRWAAGSGAKDAGAERLAGLLQDPDGLAFAVGFVDGVVRPDDLQAAGRALDRLSRRVPQFLPWWQRAAIVAGGGFAPIAPWPIVPIARRAFRGMVGHLVLDATPEKLGKQLAALDAQGLELNLNLLGEAVLGDDEAAHRLEGTRELLARPDVRTVSLKVSAVVAQISPWAFDEFVEIVAERLVPLFELAAASTTPKLVNLDMEEYRDLDLTIAVFQRILDRDSLRGLTAGIAIQAYLPDALGALDRLHDWAAERVAAGGAGIRVRLVKGANLPMERVDAQLHDWPLATWHEKVQTDANYLRALDACLRPGRVDALHLGVASHNLFDLALARALATERGVEHGMHVEMLLGMATSQREAVAGDVGRVLLYTPIVHPDEFEAGVGYLMRRLEENAADEHFLARVFELADDRDAFAIEEERFRASVALASELGDAVPAPHRIQDRSAGIELHRGPFENTPDTDPSTVGNRRWARGVLDRIPGSHRGVETLAAAAVDSAESVGRIVGEVQNAAATWGSRPAAERAGILLDAADVLEASRGRLIEVAASETGKTIAEGDVEVSEVIDFARWYADRALQLEAITEARFVPSRVTVVAPPWNFPVAIPGGSTLAALAAGSGVILKPAPQARRSAAVLCEALWEGGVPRDVLRLVDSGEGDAGRALVSDPRVDRVILTGSSETAALFRSWRSDLPILAETSGKNAIVITGSGDLDQAVADLVHSAFSHAGQKCSAASLAILVGSVGRSARFRKQLADAVQTLRVGLPTEAITRVGPIIEPADGKLLRALTQLEEGETWLVEPKQLDSDGRVWSPGVRDGVAPGSWFHTTEVFGPVLGLIAVKDLDEAIAVQNAVEYGLTAGIHALDPLEVLHWVDRVEAGNLYINRAITGAIVRRQPFGGWKRSVVGPSAKAGGPNALVPLGTWEPVEREPVPNILIDGIGRDAASVLKRVQTGLDFPGFDFVRRAAIDDERWWAAEFGVARDRSDVGVERNVMRYRPVPVTLRLAEGAPLQELARLLCAAAVTRSPVTISSSVPLPTPLTDVFASPVPPLIVRNAVVEGDASFLSRLASGAGPARLRLIGGDATAVHEALRGSIDTTIWGGPVTASGRVELLPFLREQSVTVTAHRFGTPSPAMLRLPL
jgi:RHH-type proline utilization regulon transcriptional repressor/proline dehydrogenase/delta 1-pyrroline-5-carboxylate dehydrogenase